MLFFLQVFSNTYFFFYIFLLIFLALNSPAPNKQPNTWYNCHGKNNITHPQSIYQEMSKPTHNSTSQHIWNTAVKELWGFDDIW